MAKRGEKRPWRVRFSYENGARGTETFTDLERVRLHVEELRRNAARIENPISIRLENSQTGESYELKGA